MISMFFISTYPFMLDNITLIGEKTLVSKFEQILVPLNNDIVAKEIDL